MLGKTRHSPAASLVALLFLVSAPGSSEAAGPAAPARTADAGTPAKAGTPPARTGESGAALKSSSPSGCTLADMAWMAGSWEGSGEDGQPEEHWTSPAGGTMIGMGRTVSGGKTVFFEYLRIEARPEGIFYVAHPSARKGTDFKLVRCQSSEVLFENPTHDFPKRILYRKEADGSLYARVEGDEHGKQAAEEFHYKSMKQAK